MRVNRLLKDALHTSADWEELDSESKPLFIERFVRHQQGMEGHAEKDQGQGWQGLEAERKLRPFPDQRR